ncbi:MAG: B12-binding domain-containing radical SAM protein [Syntrophales bacterium]
MKRVLLINPPDTEQGGYSNPPLGLLYLAGTLRKGGFEVRVVDGCMEGSEALARTLAEFRPDMAGVTCLTPERNKALAATRQVKDFDANILTVLGGVHPTIMHEQVMRHYPFVDFAVIGEGENTLLEIAMGEPPAKIAGIVYRHGGEVLKTAARVPEKNLDNIPFPAWGLVDLKKYPARGAGMVNGIDLAREPRVSVIFSRGCSGHCDFCSTWWIWHGWRRRSAANMADEMELLYGDFGIRHFCFADDSMTVEREGVIALCDEIISRRMKIAFHATTRTDCVDAEMLARMKAAGCYNIAFGIETSSPELLAKMGKENTVAASERAIVLCRQAGIKATALLIAGGVGETWKTIDETAVFLRRTRPDEVGCVGGLWILPGTKLYRECADRGIINDDFWLGDKPYMVYTAEHSLEGLMRMRRRVTNYDTCLSKAVSSLKRTFGWTA